MACQHFPDDQTLRLQAEAGEDAIHLPNGLDRVVFERQEEEDDPVTVYVQSPMLTLSRQASGRETTRVTIFKYNSTRKPPRWPSG